MRLAERSVRLFTVAAFSTAIAVLLTVQAMELEHFSVRRIGVSVSQGQSGLRVTQVAPGLPAERAGVKPGDEIVAVAGKPIRHLADYDAEATAFERGRRVALVVSRAGVRHRLSLVPGANFPWGQYAVSCLGVLAYLALGALALVQRAHDLRARLLFLFSFAVAFELALPTSVIGSLRLFSAAITCYYLVTGLQIGLELHLASVIPEARPWLLKRPWLVPFYYSVGLALGGVTAATSLVEEVFGYDVFPWSPNLTQSLLLRVGLPLWGVAVAAILVVQAARSPEPRGRHQAGLVLAGVLPWVLFVIAMAGYDLADRPAPQLLASLEPLVLLCYPAAVFAAIFRYHLFDLEVAVKRGLVYTSLTGALLLVFYATVGAGGAVLSSLFEGNDPSVWAISAATLILGLLFSPLRRALERTIEHRLFPERRAMRQRLVELARELPALGKLPLMGRHLVSSLCEIFSARSATLLIADPGARLLSVLATSRKDVDAEDPILLLDLADPGLDALRRSGKALPAAQVLAKSRDLERHAPFERSQVLVPLLRQGKMSGLLALGRKEGSSSFTGEELELLNLLSHHVVTVLENARLFESATFESLTGLLRREAVLEHLDRELERALRYHRPLTVGLADLDHFKDINDRYGHLAGDSMLKRISRVMAEALRASDLIGRYGGEEFLLVLPETDLEGARQVAEKIRCRVEATDVRMEDDSEATVTVSIGLSSLHRFQVVGEEPTPRKLIAAADHSLYLAKAGGRNQVQPPVQQIG